MADPPDIALTAHPPGRQPVRAAPRPSPQDMARLLRPVAAGDHHAFRTLYGVLGVELADHLRDRVADPADVGPLLAETLLEVWWLARFHEQPGTDVRAWVRGIADRRLADRRRALPPATDRSPAEALAVRAVLDRCRDNELRAVLDGTASARWPRA
ncbi:MAG TPA: hypothetical protein VES42_07765 [Pilimelia sp.]|nr:hypothetical protein [Pilimelia sp.]